MGLSINSSIARDSPFFDSHFSLPIEDSINTANQLRVCLFATESRCDIINLKYSSFKIWYESQQYIVDIFRLSSFVLSNYSKCHALWLRNDQYNLIATTNKKQQHTLSEYNLLAVDAILMKSSETYVNHFYNLIFFFVYLRSYMTLIQANFCVLLIGCFKVFSPI